MYVGHPILKETSPQTRPMKQALLASVYTIALLCIAAKTSAFLYIKNDAQHFSQGLLANDHNIHRINTIHGNYSTVALPEVWLMATTQGRYTYIYYCTSDNGIWLDIVQVWQM